MNVDQQSRTDSKDARNKRIFDLWLACHTQEEIAIECQCDQKTVTNVLSGEMEDRPKFLNAHPHASHSADFDPPLYNGWKQQAVFI